ncbi:hypothetical protein [Rhodococcus marinonascens]|uniref:hypothetical protein n=1 Tax=Rhodococcus marinonascens TaxID=38311 RepID=UPI000B12B855|nr:hypothetical protein [Rhodococcus marinonascens]
MTESPRRATGISVSGEPAPTAAAAVTGALPDSPRTPRTHPPLGEASPSADEIPFLPGGDLELGTTMRWPPCSTRPAASSDRFTGTRRQSAAPPVHPADRHPDNAASATSAPYPGSAIAEWIADQ